MRVRIVQRFVFFLRAHESDYPDDLAIAILTTARWSLRRLALLYLQCKPQNLVWVCSQSLAFQQKSPLIVSTQPTGGTSPITCVNRPVRHGCLESHQIGKFEYLELGFNVIHVHVSSKNCCAAVHHAGCKKRVKPQATAHACTYLGMNISFRGTHCRHDRGIYQPMQVGNVWRVILFLEFRNNQFIVNQTSFVSSCFSQIYPSRGRGGSWDSRATASSASLADPVEAKHVPRDISNMRFSHKRVPNRWLQTWPELSASKNK
jgi:hypothetical protein